jgi:hypothetical protein
LAVAWMWATRLRQMGMATKLDTSKNAVLTADLKGLLAIGQ